MNPEFDEVLLTAYLDNEVTEAERAKVEQQLRASESSRMLLEELRSVRTLVAQLHLSQSSRNFQVGPWNETNSSNQASSVVLNDPGSKWNMSYQKLASIAALIAIVVCTSVLFLGPYRNSISHRSTGTNAARDEKPIDLAIKESVPTDQETVELVIRPGIASPSRTLSLPLGNEGLPRLEKNAADVSLPMSRGTAGAGFDNPQMGLAVNDSTKGGLGGGGSNAPLAKRKSAESENRMIESPPAPMLVDPANLGLELSKAEAQVQQTEPSAQLFFDSLFAMPSKDRGEWEAVDSKSNRDSYFFQKGQLADVLKRQAGELSPNDESIARLSFRYKNTQEQEKVLNEKGGQSAATPSDYVLTENKPTEDPIQTEADEKKSALVPILLEFQIPSEEWQNGAKQLRKFLCQPFPTSVEQRRPVGCHA